MRWQLIALLAVVPAALAGVVAFAQDKKDQKTRFFEMRTYIANPGKMQALHARFRDHTNKLFVKHGMELVGYWTPTAGENADHTLVYILAYPSEAARKTSWDAFQNDPDWKKAKADSEKEGGLVSKVISQFLAPTDYSPIK
jgi:NIPSNAP protein